MPIRIKDKEKFEEISKTLEAFDVNAYRLAGLTTAGRKLALVAQLIDSI